MLPSTAFAGTGNVRLFTPALKTVPPGNSSSPVSAQSPSLLKSIQALSVQDALAVMSMFADVPGIIEEVKTTPSSSFVVPLVSSPFASADG